MKVFTFRSMSKKILVIFLFFTSFHMLLSQENEVKNKEYESNLYSFELPADIWFLPNKSLIDKFRQDEIEISKKNKIKYTDFEFLLSLKTDDNSILYTPLVKVTNTKTTTNQFEKMKKAFGIEVMEKSFIIDDNETLFSLKPVVDSKRQTIQISTKSNGIYGFSKLFFSNNSIIQFTYTDFEENQCIDCLIIFLNSLNKTFKFK